MNRRLKVGIDLAPIGFRRRAPGTAAHVEHQALALLALPVEWDWILVTTPRASTENACFDSFKPIVSPDAPLSYHASVTLGQIWKRTGCALGLATAFFTPFFGPPVVTNYFDANFFHPVPDYHSVRGRARLAVLRMLWRHSRRRSRALFIDSDYGRARMIQADPATAEKWVVAPCGCPPVGPGAINPPLWANDLGGAPFILYVGAFSENKNQRRLIEAWDQLRRRNENTPRLVLVGPCPPEYHAAVIAPLLSTVHRPGEILLTGFVSPEEKAWAFRNARAYLQPSFAEGFGLPVVEAMSCDLPVACSNSTSLPEVAGDAAVLFDSSNVADLANAIEKIVFDENCRPELKKRGRKRAEFFTWERHAKIVTDRIRLELARLSL